MEYLNKPTSITMSEVDLGDMYIASIRYLIGRRTALVASALTWTRAVLHTIPTSKISVVLRDIDEAYDLGDSCDIEVWNSVRALLVEELEKRN